MPAKNRTALGLEERVELVEGDLLSWTDGPWDMILTNPPYLRPSRSMGISTCSAEPRLALDGGAGGLELIEQILDQAVTRVSPRFAMMIEIDPDQADAARALAVSRFPGANVIIVPDLTGRARFVASSDRRRLRDHCRQRCASDAVRRDQPRHGPRVDRSASMFRTISSSSDPTAPFRRSIPRPGR